MPARRFGGMSIGEDSMLTKRIIPCLDVNKGRVVKGVNFVNLKDAGDPVEIAKAYDKEGAGEQGEGLRPARRDQACSRMPRGRGS